MSKAGESVILPSNAVFLVHKVGTSKAGHETQWETRAKAMRAAPDPHKALSIRSNNTNDAVKTKSDAAEGGSWQFVSYTPRKDQQLQKRPKKGEPKRKRRTQTNNDAQKNKSTSIVSIKQNPTLLRNPNLLPPDLPVAIVGHALLYINFYFHSIATGAYTLPCLLFNPAKRDWFPRMMQDEAWRCIILSLSASTLASLTGSPSNYVDSHALLDEALRQLKSRVASGALPSDQTLGAISCLSMWSNEQGNLEKAWVHAKGLAELVKLRGGFSKISDGMRSKVYRGVFDIAVNSDRPPLLEDGLRGFPENEVIVSEDDGSEREESGLDTSECRISSHLSSIFDDVVQFSATVDEAMTRNIKLDTNPLYELVFGLYNRLLSCQSDSMSGCDNSFRICLILYIKSIVSHDCPNPTSMHLVKKLQASLQDCLAAHPSTSLTKWKLFVGGMAATDGTCEKQWFVQRLAETLTENEVEREGGWELLQAELGSIVWTKPINEAAGYRLWLQIADAQP
ncbi:uncharacterized protein TRIREDRAFT_111516 [Trichoderma reesei QM6a]|uniref:Predicted protein n=2 Tax=Hypocrea jecorina TaxID=51453 RepID=G0RUT1_HYPJQ|nr:uncharacterized protein TRIREDRAFT_111516 [Trichoderma reesei QM6a]EGR45051.1 predicted protein [Trichoderma reesei QM6a]ETR98208.1 hypothetical protein M419DRAFT_89381 [Trichoderma reesei RUT C-30]